MTHQKSISFADRPPGTPRFDELVIGGGIVGLAVAWAILERNPGTRLALVEKEADWARHQTGRNSGVMHSGIYYQPGSLKAKLCRDGNRRLLEFCSVHGIPHETCGKLIVATSAAEIPGMRTLFDRGVANGLPVRRLDASAVREIEPHVRCVEGIHVASTGIVDYRAVCRTLAGLIAARGGELLLNTKVTGFRAEIGESITVTSTGPIAARRIINCAGLQSDRVARLAGLRPDARIVPFRGEYYQLKPERRHLVRNLVYPVPDPAFPFLGVHFTRMIDGSVHAGPNAVLSFKREGYHRTSFDLHDCLETLTYPGFWRLAARHAGSGLREMHRSFSKPEFVRSLQRIVPEIQSDDLVPAEAGVRAQALRSNGALVDDFMILSGANTIHICNAPSPAATAALEIGRVVVDRLPECH
jgi:L-2-hydroxyglutarate oxidase